MIELLSLKMHETLTLENHYVMRVFGGWIYADRRGKNAVGTFVPIQDHHFKEPFFKSL